MCHIKHALESQLFTYIFQLLVNISQLALSNLAKYQQRQSSFRQYLDFTITSLNPLFDKLILKLAPINLFQLQLTLSS